MSSDQGFVRLYNSFGETRPGEYQNGQFTKANAATFQYLAEGPDGRGARGGVAEVGFAEERVLGNRAQALADKGESSQRTIVKEG